MPPKKTLKNSKKKKTEKPPEQDLLESKYQRSCLDVAILQDYVATQSESVIRVQSDRSDLRRRVRDVEQRLQHERQDHRDISSDLSRQYKTMQTELSNKVKSLEKEVSTLKEELAQCQEELKKEKRQLELVTHEKDTIIDDLQHKQKHMEAEFEKILHETLDDLTSQLTVARHEWDKKGAALHQSYKEILKEFSLDTLDIN